MAQTSLPSLCDLSWRIDMAVERNETDGNTNRESQTGAAAVLSGVEARVGALSHLTHWWSFATSTSRKTG